ncbi:MAG: serine/threonine protein kinase, partial [Cystobacter sp.]
SVPGVPAPVKGRALPVKSLAGGLLLLVLVGAAYVFHKPILEMLGSTALDGQAVTVSLETNIPVDVFVRHTARCRSSESLTHLGSTPLRQAPGAHLQDTLILENKQVGLHQELEELRFGEPNSNKDLGRREFTMGKVRFKLQPSRLSGIEIFRNGQKLGLYSPGLALELVEGTHHLLLQGPSLREAVQVDVEVKGRDVVNAEADLREYLQ